MCVRACMCVCVCARARTHTLARKRASKRACQRIHPPQLCTWAKPSRYAHPKAQVDHPVSPVCHCMHEALYDIRVLCTILSSKDVARHHTIACRAHHACNAACVPVTPTTSHGSHHMGAVGCDAGSCATGRLVVGVPCTGRSVVASIFRASRRVSMYACPARTGAVAHSHSNGPGQQSRQAIWLF